MKKWKKICLASMSVASVLVLSACGDSSNAKNVDRDLTLWSNQVVPSDVVKDWKESPFHAGLAKASGVEVDWTFPTKGADASQAFNLMLADKQLPDMIWAGLMNNADEYLDDGTLRDLTDDLPEKAPNYWKWLQDHPEYDKAFKTDDGRYYMVGFFREEPEQTVFIGPQIRQDWLDEQNLEMPTNIAEWENVIETFNKEYGAKMIFTTDWWMSPGFSGAFGAYGGFEPSFYIDDDNNIQMAQVQPEWKEYLEWLNSLYSKGLIDPDFATADGTVIDTKVAQDKTGTISALGSRINANNSAAKENGKTAQWVAAPYPNQADGSKPSAIFMQDMYIDHGVGITTSIPDELLDEAFAWLDFPFTEEGRLYWNYGEEGVSWEDIDGVPTFTDEVLNNSKYDLGTAVSLYSGNLGYGLGVQELNLNRQRSDEASFNAAKVWLGENDDYGKRMIPTGVSKTNQELKESATITNTLNSYVKENAIDFITGRRSLDDFDKFVKELEDQGLEQLLQIQQDSYERFENR